MGTDDIIYNIPVARWEHYRNRSVILRSADPREIAAALCETDQQNIVSLQILSLTGLIDPQIKKFLSIPVDLLLLDVEREYPNLYQWSALPEVGPARVTIPVVPGFGKAVKTGSGSGICNQARGYPA